MSSPVVRGGVWVVVVVMVMGVVVVAGCQQRAGEQCASPSQPNPTQLTDAVSADARVRLDVHEVTDGEHQLLSLRRQLARGAQHERLHPVVAHTQAHNTHGG
jgi:hypothetical protein